MYVTHNYLFQKRDEPTRRSLAISAGSRAEIRWLPNSVIRLAQVVRDCNTTVDMRSFGSIFAESLPGVAFVRDWTGTNGLDPHQAR